MLLLGICAAAGLFLARCTPALRVVHDALGPLSLLFFVPAGAVLLSSVRAFWRAGTTVNPVRVDSPSELVTTGLYRWSRNPMYVAMAFVLLGEAVWLGSPVASLVVVPFVALINAFQIRDEEAALEREFGEAFEQYRETTPRWLGRVERSA